MPKATGQFLHPPSPNAFILKFLSSPATHLKIPNRLTLNSLQRKIILAKLA